MNQIPTATLLVSYTHQDEQEQQAFDTLAERLSHRLEQPVVACALDQPDRPVLAAITALLQQGVVKIVILPLFLSQADYQTHTLADAVAFAGGRWPHAHFHLSPLPTWSEWLRVVWRLALEAMGTRTDGVAPLTSRRGEPLSPPFGGLGRLRRNETAVILVGPGASDPAINSDLTKLARLLYEDHTFGWVDVAFVTGTTPTIGDLLARYQILGAKQIIVVTCFLFAGHTYQQLLSQVEEFRGQELGVRNESLIPDSQSLIPNSQFTITSCLSPHNTLIDVLLARHQAALADRTLLPVSWENIQMQLAAEMEAEHKRRPGQPAADEATLQEMLAKIDQILPPRYQEGRMNQISAAPTAADLVFDDDGAVRWEQMVGLGDRDNPWGDLALAGGAAHRDELLEAVNPDDCLAEPERYAAVLDEIGRGIHTLTGLSIVESKAPGWLGVQCDSQEMAIWLVRAIIVENIMVRREADVIYLPAGPHYALENEILSIVTVMAKTWRFWIIHITAKQWGQDGTNEELLPEINNIDR